LDKVLCYLVSIEKKGNEKVTYDQHCSTKNESNVSVHFFIDLDHITSSADIKIYSKMAQGIAKKVN